MSTKSTPVEDGRSGLRKWTEELPKIDDALKNFVTIVIAQLSVSTESDAERREDARAKGLRPRSPAAVIQCARAFSLTLNESIHDFPAPLEFETANPQGDMSALDRIAQISEYKLIYVLSKKISQATTTGAKATKLFGKSFLRFLLLSMPSLNFEGRLYRRAADQDMKRQLQWMYQTFRSCTLDSEKGGGTRAPSALNREYLILCWSKNFRQDLAALQRKKQIQRKEEAAERRPLS
eukprot:g2120.t1